MAEIDGVARALDAVRQRLSEIPAPPGDAWTAVEDDVVEFALGWVVSWTSRRFAETGELRHSPIGDGPMLVERGTFEVVALPSALSTEECIGRYLEWQALPAEVRAHWSPLMVPDELIVMVDAFARGANTSARQAADIVEWIETNGARSDEIGSLRVILADFKAGRRTTSSDAARTACQVAMRTLRPPLTFPPCPRCGGQLGDHRKALIRNDRHLVCQSEATCGECHAEVIGREVAADQVVWTLG